MNTVIEEYC